MRGLLLKEIYMTEKYCKSFLLVVVVFLAIAFFQSESVFFLLYPVIMVSMIPMTLLSYDEREKWDKYSATLPYTRAQIVSSKYLIGFVSNAAVFLLTAVIYAVKLLHKGAFELGDYLDLCGVIFSAGMMAPIIIYPCLFKLGSEKGRIAYYICIGIICAVSTILLTSELQLSEGVNFNFNISAICIAAIVLYLLSWRLSVAFYEKREL